MEVDRSGCEVLSRNECLRLLAKESVGRLAMHAGALPVIVPVAYAFVDDAVVVRTHDGSQLYGAARSAVVAFEVDCLPGTDGSGWSVHVTGLAEEVTDRLELARLRRIPLRSWGEEGPERFMRVSVDLISGRRFVPAVA